MASARGRWLELRLAVASSLADKAQPHISVGHPARPAFARSVVAVRLFVLARRVDLSYTFRLVTSAIRDAARLVAGFGMSLAKWAYRGVLCTMLWVGSLPIKGKPSLTNSPPLA